MWHANWNPSPSVTRPRISIIVPAYNAAGYLAECIGALRASAGPDTDIIVVDDASTDSTAAVARDAGARVITLAQNSGPGRARNRGAREADGEILFFVDADVIVAPDAFACVAKAFEHDPELGAVFGSYDTHPRAPGVVSQYRNLLHHFTHQQGNPDASTFWAGCGAIRRDTFEAVGGFDAERFPRPSIEDIDLGLRLRQAGFRILLDKHMQGTHLKRWTLRSTIWTDVTCRAIPWSRLILENGAPNDLNLKRSQRLSVWLVGLASVFVPLGAFSSSFLGLAAAALVAVLLLNLPLFAFFVRQRGMPFALACGPLHLSYFLYSGLSYLYVWITIQLSSARLWARRIEAHRHHGSTRA